jgi:hypothetical protein
MPLTVAGLRPGAPKQHEWTGAALGQLAGWRSGAEVGDVVVPDLVEKGHVIGVRAIPHEQRPARGGRGNLESVFSERFPRGGIRAPRLRCCNAVVGGGRVAVRGFSAP